MKIAVSSYVVMQALFIAAWLIGLFNISVFFAFIPTFVVIAFLVAMFCLLKLVERFIELDDDDDPSGVFGLDDLRKDEDEEKE